MDGHELDEVLGITRCVRCGQRLEGEAACPVCSGYYADSPGTPLKRRIPKWVYLTACFLTSPLSLWFIVKSKRLSDVEKALAASGCLLWAAFGSFRLF
jgi:hypothetical protein